MLVPTAERLDGGLTENVHCDVYDLVCVGFGPASLAIAVALHDKGIHKRVLYLERQRKFVWHGGMLLPDTRMQISFLKDLATLRDPRSHFTFLNYLKCKNRLVTFTNLSTFLPLREEYNDYLTWCASHFDPDVRYGEEAVDVFPHEGEPGRVESWNILSINAVTHKETTVRARHVVIALGGKPNIPLALKKSSPAASIIHSSSYSNFIAKIVKDERSKCRVAVVGGGQSAAEIFNDLQSRFSTVDATLFTGDSALRPSDDSPFVNEIFDPERVDDFYDLPRQVQQGAMMKDKATNYSVVRPALLDHLYDLMYHQRLREPDESKWRHKIITSREVVGHQNINGRIQLQLRNTLDDARSLSEASFDLVIAATGYSRNAHESILGSTRDLLENGKFEVRRDYRIKYKKECVAESCGVWLQGCCQDSHGLSDTLLSILAVRGGKMVDSIFP